MSYVCSIHYLDSPLPPFSTIFDKRGIVFFLYFVVGVAQMNTAPRSNASRNIWGPSPGGLDDIADLQRMLGGIPGASSENQLIGYPSISQIMQHINQVFIYLICTKAYKQSSSLRFYSFFSWFSFFVVCDGEFLVKLLIS